VTSQLCNYVSLSTVIYCYLAADIYDLPAWVSTPLEMDDNLPVSE
jgi:hypothetical protein